MTSKQKIVLGAAALVITTTLVVAAYRIGKLQGEAEAKKRLNPNGEEESNTDGYAPVELTSEDLMPLLNERIYIVQNRQKYRDPKAEGHQKFLDRTKAALLECEEKDVDFHDTKEAYLLTRGSEILASVKKEFVATPPKQETAKEEPKEESPKEA
jgi:hypothetical protein